MINRKFKKTPKNYMDIVPAHNPSYKWHFQEDGIVVIDITDNAPFKLLLFRRASVRHISLDQHGSKLWMAIDGQKTIYDILNIMLSEFPSEKSNMLDRVIIFMQILQNNQLVLKK